jgi:hypothetical protein
MQCDGVKSCGCSTALKIGKSISNILAKIEFKFTDFR